MKELEFIDTFCEYLDSLGYKYKREFRKGSYHSEGYVDIVVKDRFLIGIEAKVSGFKAVVRQAWGNTFSFKLNYVLYPRIPRTYDYIKDTCIGLIIPEDHKFKVIRKPKFSKRFSKYTYKKIILRNWRENRIGRRPGVNEVPEDYDEEKLNNIIPTYAWVNKVKIKKKTKTLFDFGNWK